MIDAREMEIVRNYRYFSTVVNAAMANHEGEYALLRDCEIVEFFPTASAAVAEGARRYGVLPFSIQHVINRPLDLGFLSHATDHGVSV